MQVMNKSLQKAVIKRLLEKKGFASDTVDVESLIDSSLHLPENIREIERQLGIKLTDNYDYTVDDEDEENLNEQLYEYLAMELGEEFYEILDEIEQEEENKEKAITEIRKEVEEMIRESEERIKSEQRSRSRQLVEYWEEKRKLGLLFDYMANLIAPHLVGRQYFEIRRAALIVLASYTEMETTHRTRIHMLLTGEPGTGKTEILKWIEDYLSPYNIKTEFADGTRMSKAGLTVDARGKEPTYGALVKAHKGLLLLDEIDKAKPEDLNALLSAMEHGRFKITVGGVDEYFDAEVRVMATSNYIERLPRQLVDRFDFVYELKLPTPEERKKEVDLMVDSFFGDVDPTASAFELGMFLQHISKFRPAIVREDKDRIKKVLKAYIDLRKGGLTELSRRQFEVSVLRIAYAIAKVNMRDMTARDIIHALTLKDPSIVGNKTVVASLYAHADGKL